MLKSSNDNWNLVENDFSLDLVMAYEALMAQGNGFMHIRGSHEDQVGAYDSSREYWRMPTNVTAEEFTDSECKYGFYIPGIYGEHPILGQELVNLPYFLGISLSVGSEKFSLTGSNISNYSRVLDLKTATLTRSYIWHTISGANISLTFSRYLSAANVNFCMQKIVIVSDADEDILVTSVIDADVRTNGFNHFNNIKLEHKKQGVARCSVGTDSDTVIITSKVISESDKYKYDCIGNRNEISFELNVKANKESIVEKHTCVETDKDNGSSKIDLINCNLTYDELHLLHLKEWEMWWNKSDILIDGDSNSQLAIRISIYHLLRCKVISQVSIDAKGYSGDAYFGRFFWDTEVFMLPFYIFTFPESAKKLLEFRVNSLGGALLNAKEYGYYGAKYAWESSMSGLEQCACWQYADHEIHIGADIVYAIDNYRRLVDNDFITENVARVIVEIARFYLSRIDFHDSQNKPNLLGVMGPDEYTPISDNNAYTNWMVKFTLKLASQVGEKAGISDVEKASFIDTAVNLRIPRKNDDLILQCDNFDELAEINFDEYWPGRQGVFARKVSQERIYRSKCLKQADVIMLMMLFSKHFSLKELAAAWNYYLPYTTHDSSLSVAVHAKVALQLGKLDNAVDFWKKSMAIDFDLEDKGSEEGVHIASYGMNWQLLVFGFGGVDKESDDGILRIDPILPGNWNRLAFPLIWQGNDIFIDISNNEIIVVNLGPKVIELVCRGRLVDLSPNTSMKLLTKNNENKEVISEIKRENYDKRCNIRP